MLFSTTSPGNTSQPTVTCRVEKIYAANTVQIYWTGRYTGTQQDCFTINYVFLVFAKPITCSLKGAFLGRRKEQNVDVAKLSAEKQLLVK